MQAVVKYANVCGATELRDVPIPVPGEGEVLVKVHYAGICGGDPHIHTQTMSYPETVPVPLILGHECAGVVEKAGDAVCTVKAGDRVVIETHDGFCGHCFFCRQGMFNHCADRKGLGAGVDGAFAEYVKVTEAVVHRLPDSLSLRKASLTEPLCIVYNAIINQAGFKGGETVAVVGVGTIGLLAALLAKALGASRIVVIGTVDDAERLRLAEQMGIPAVQNSFGSESILQEYTNGLGFDLVVDAAGNNHAFAFAEDLVRRGGKISKIGFGPKAIDRSLDSLILRGISVHFAFSHTWSVWDACVKLLDGDTLDVEPLITHELPLSEFEKGFKLVESLEGIKVLLIPAKTTL
jgi:alcohol dehydrogenase/L-iditol 2-dehydrogenase